MSENGLCGSEKRRLKIWLKSSVERCTTLASFEREDKYPQRHASQVEQTTAPWCGSCSDDRETVRVTSWTVNFEPGEEPKEEKEWPPVR